MITQEQLKTQLHYNPETGIFTRMVQSSNYIKAGEVAGSLTKTGYIEISVLSERRLAHRLAWLYVVGNMPVNGFIDHINGIKTDNRMSNLRDVSVSDNLKNAKRRNDNKSGFTGVSWHKSAGKWEAYITSEKVTYNLGLFENLSDAVFARVSKEVEYKFSSNHGR